jgi:hypothetical protein
VNENQSNIERHRDAKKEREARETRENDVFWRGKKKSEAMYSNI